MSDNASGCAGGKYCQEQVVVRNGAEVKVAFVSVVDEAVECVVA